MQRGVKVSSSFQMYPCLPPSLPHQLPFLGILETSGRKAYCRADTRSQQGTAFSRRQATGGALNVESGPLCLRQERKSFQFSCGT